MSALLKFWPVIVTGLSLMVYVIQADRRLSVLEDNFNSHVEYQRLTFDKDITAIKILLLRICDRTSDGHQECKIQ